MDSVWVRRLCAAMIAIECAVSIVMAVAFWHLAELFLESFRPDGVTILDRFVTALPLALAATVFFAGAFMLVLQNASESTNTVVLLWLVLAPVIIGNVFIVSLAGSETDSTAGTVFLALQTTYACSVIVLVLATQLSRIQILFGTGRPRSAT